MIDNINEILFCDNCLSGSKFTIQSLNKANTDSEKKEKKKLICESCGNFHFIIDDVIHINSGKILESSIYQSKVYSYWWNKSHKELIYDDNENKNIFESTIKFSSENIVDKCIFDAGCGNGRFVRVLENYKPKLYVISDISDGIYTSKEILKKNNIDFVAIKGDLSSLPLKEYVFDFVYSWGVIHHTEKPKVTFKNLAKTVKNNGYFGVYVYKNNPDFQFDNEYIRLLYLLRQIFLIYPLRAISNLLSEKNVIRLFKPIYYFEKLIGYGLVGCHKNKGNKFEKESYFRIVIDRFKTKHASEHQEFEIAKWFFNEGFNDIIFGTHPKIGAIGKKIKDKKQTLHISLNVEKN